MAKQSWGWLVVHFIIVGALVTMATAQDTKEGVAALNGGKTTIFLKAPSQIMAADTDTGPQLATIYSNLGTGKDVYNGNAGNGVLGPDAGQLYMEWIGNGFRPKADHVVTKIQVGVTYVQGVNAVTMSFNEDNGGKPGKPLHTWQFATLPNFGTCCILETGKLTTGIKVSKGKLYWVVLRTNAKTKNTWDVWNNDFSGKQGVWSNDIGSGWTKASTQQQNAYGVFGK